MESCVLYVYFLIISCLQELNIVCVLGFPLERKSKRVSVHACVWDLKFTDGLLVLKYAFIVQNMPAEWSGQQYISMYFFPFYSVYVGVYRILFLARHCMVTYSALVPRIAGRVSKLRTKGS